MKKYNTGLLIGRFQPFHLGHLHLMRKAFKHVGKIIIGVANTGNIDTDNPMSFEDRVKMLEVVIKKEGWREKMLKVVQVKDYLEDDDLWARKAIEVAGKFDVVIGNNEWTNKPIEKKGYPVLRLGLYKRHLYEGKKIRQLARAGKNWQDRIPSIFENIPLLQIGVAQEKCA